MEKHRHHYVPQFYLRAFASAPRRIHLYNFKNNIFIKDTSLRKQCYINHFYGETDNIENRLASLEADLAPAIQKITTTGCLPKSDSAEHLMLYVFIALQSLRTAAVARSAKESFDRANKLMFPDGVATGKYDKYNLEVDPGDIILMALSNTSLILSGINDLKLHLIQAPKYGRFITSDNPIFKYNQYNQDVKDVGQNGILNSGFQIFLPLSPEFLILLYDKHVYRVGDTVSNTTKNIDDNDLKLLNIMQMAGANQSVYFSDWNDVTSVESLIKKAKKHRNNSQPIVEELIEKGNENQSLIHFYEPLPNLGLGLSFVSIRRNARRVPLFERMTQLRKPMPSGFDNPYTQLPIKHRTLFVRPNIKK